MAVTPQQPVAYIAPTDSSVDNSDQVVVTGVSQGPPTLSISQMDAVVIEVTSQVA